MNLTDIPPELFRHHIVPHLPNINFVKTCKTLWRLKFKAREALIERALMQRGKNIRISLFHKIGVLDEFEKRPFLSYFPKPFDRDLLKTVSGRKKDPNFSPDLDGCMNIYAVFNDKTRSSEDKPALIPDTWFFCDPLKVQLPEGDHVHVVRRHNIDAIASITFSERIERFELDLGERCVIFRGVREIRFLPMLPILAMPFTEMKMLLMGIQKGTTMRIERIVLSQDERACLASYLDGLPIPFVTDTGEGNVAYIKSGCACFLFSKRLRATPFLTGDIFPFSNRIFDVYGIEEENP